MIKRRHFHNILLSGFGRQNTDVLVRITVLNSQLASGLEPLESFPILYVENKDNAYDLQENAVKIRYHLYVNKNLNIYEVLSLKT